MADLTRDEVRALLEGATPGPWLKSAHDDRDNPTWDLWAQAEVDRTGGDNGCIAFDIRDADARLMAAAPELARLLLEAMERDAQQVDAATEGIACGVHPSPRLPTIAEAPDVCPYCGGVDFEPSFGLAGGGYGAYLACAACSQIVGKDQEP